MIDKANKIAFAITHNRDDFNEDDFLYLKECLENKMTSCVVFCDNSKAGQYIKVTFDKRVVKWIEESDKDFFYLNVYDKEQDKQNDRQFIVEALYENIGGEYSIVLSNTDNKVTEII